MASEKVITLDSSKKYADTYQEVDPLEENPKIVSRDLSVYYGDFQALKDINLEIPEKKITALIGPSGCGKSTFLKSINRMIDLVLKSKVEGEIILDGEDIYGKDIDPIDIRQKVGMVFQKPNPFPKSIFNNVAYGPRLYGIKNKEILQMIVEESLKKAALWDEVKDKLNGSAFALSGGQQQRLCIARAIAVEPEVVLMDEPASALDPVATSKIESLAQQLSKEHTIIIVTHNMQQAARISDYTAFFMVDDFKRGTLVEFDSTANIFTNPQNTQTADYITGRFG